MQGLCANLPSPLVIGRAPFADVFDMAKTPQADFVFVQATHIAAGRRHRRTDIAVERLGRADRSWLSHALQAFEIELDTSLLPDDALKHFTQLLFALVAHPALAFFVVIEMEAAGDRRQPQLP